MSDDAESLYVNSYFRQTLYMGDINSLDKHFLEVCPATHAYYEVYWINVYRNFTNLIKDM